MKLLLIIVTFFLSMVKANSQSQYLIIDKNFKYDLRVYFFIDMSSCDIHFNNVKKVASDLKNYNIEYVVFINSIRQEQAVQLNDELQLDCRIIADEFGVFWDRFGISATPTTIFLDNDGYLVGIATPTNKIEIRKVIEYIESKNEHSKNEKAPLQLLSRTNVKIDGKSLIGGFFNRDLLYDTRRNVYYLRNDFKHNFYIINENGNVVKSLTTEDYPEFAGYNSTYQLSWFCQDSLLLLSGAIYPFDRFIQLYDVVNDSLHPRVIIELNQYIATNAAGDTIANNDLFMTFANSSCNYFLSSLRSRSREKLSKDTYTIFRYNRNGDIIDKYSSPDSIYQRYNISNWFRESFGSDKKGNIYTIQSYSNILRIWNSDMLLLKELYLDLSDLYKLPKSDIPILRGNIELTREFENNTSRNFYNGVLVDNTNNHILIAFKNTYMPEGIGDSSHRDVESSTVLLVFDSNGKRVYDEPIIINTISIPFHFDSGEIVSSELNQNRELQIVRYKLNK